MNNPLLKNETNYIHYTDPFAVKTTSELLITYLPKAYSQLVVLCIGTDRSTGDSLGPLTGTFLSQMNPSNLKIYGTLHDPVHAINLQEKTNLITSTYKNPFIIAVDASLGKSTSIGCFISGMGSLQPGAALEKNLPAVGDAFLTGVVNINGFMEYAVLQSTRLSIVHDMSYKLALTLKRLDISLSNINNTKKVSKNSVYLKQMNDINNDAYYKN